LAVNKNDLCELKKSLHEKTEKIHGRINDLLMALARIQEGIGRTQEKADTARQLAISNQARIDRILELLAELPSGRPGKAPARSSKRSHPAPRSPTRRKPAPGVRSPDAAA
jgi:uncharacterized membrane protein YccC